MATVVLVIHLLIAAALVGVVLLQRSEGGGLGMGGGGGGFMTGRGQANFLTRVTAMLAAAFFTTSIVLTIIAQRSAPTGSAFDNRGTTTEPAAPATPGAPAAPGQGGGGGILDKLQSPVPQNQ